MLSRTLTAFLFRLPVFRFGESKKPWAVLRHHALKRDREQSARENKTIRHKEAGMENKLETALEIIASAKKKAGEIGVPMVISVVDEGGNPVATQRMDDALLVSVDLALNKAYTAAAVKVPTDLLSSVAAPGGELYGLHAAGRMVIFGGGIPLEREGRVVGGVGVSGGSVEQDIACAEAAVARFNTLS